MKARGIRASLAIVLILLTALILNACATTSFRISPNLPHRNSDTKVLLMPMDVELNTLTAGGILKPEAEWTAKAIAHVETSIIRQMTDLHVGLITPSEMTKVVLTPEEEENKTQLIKLHGVVGHSIKTHQYNPEFALPTKQNTFEWTLGPQTKMLKEKYGADYAMFVYMRDSYASGGRVAVAMFAAIFGISVQMGVQTGFASLIDLETGEVVWFNTLLRTVGDLRTPDYASASVSILLKDFPQ